MKVNHFNYKEERGQNPYIGFTSFQHFRNDPLYSDIVVKPENNMRETEDVEPYPVPAHVPQNGREEGFYPDSTVAYIRILWKEFEPVQGEYHYEVIEDVLRKADECGQTVMFRLMPHSTRAEDDVPDWLREIVDCPIRPEGARLKDSPKDPLYLELFGKAWEKIAEKYDDDPRLDIVDICLPGSWGEGHKIEEYPEEVLKAHMDVYTRAFKNTHLLGQVLHLILHVMQMKQDLLAGELMELEIQNLWKVNLHMRRVFYQNFGKNNRLHLKLTGGSVSGSVKVGM